MSGSLKRTEARIMQEVMSLLSERDAGIRDAFSKFDGKIQQFITQLEFQFAVIFNCLGEAGLSEEKIKEITENIKQQLSEQKTGVQNESPYDNPTAPESVEHIEEPGGDTVKEGGQEFFTRDG
jgi:hypothetical protein